MVELQESLARAMRAKATEDIGWEWRWEAEWWAVGEGRVVAVPGWAFIQRT